MADKKNIELPEAGVSQELDNFELWVVENRKKIVVVSAILVVVIATGVCTWRWFKNAENRSRDKGVSPVDPFCGRKELAY